MGILHKLNNVANLVQNMGWRYVSFRTKHELLRRSGILKHRFPVNVLHKKLPGLSTWQEQKGKFFFEDKNTLSVPRQLTPELTQRFEAYCAGKLYLFNSISVDLGTGYDWITNPDTGYRYDVSKHWTDIPDYSKEAGDIKFVWEKSRFSFLYDIIRYDHHAEKDCAEMVFEEIISWIRKNPVNCGPNYRCSQEISLRVLNWIFALNYYASSPTLTAEVFEEIQQSIFWQVHHVYQNIDFSRIAVRNNHAITETLTLFLAGLLFPYVPEFKAWSKKGKKWLEEEIAYQVYKDGTFLQFSMNYHRVVIQLLTWGIRLSELNEERLSPVVYDRAQKSLLFLRVCMDDATGWLPNYGSNDGALFFRLNEDHYRNYRTQLGALADVLGTDAQTGTKGEDSGWYGVSAKEPDKKIDLSGTVYRFEQGGYYVFREKDTLSFIRCGNHKDRPAQADNLHLDIWYKGRNILQDAGSYKYNTDEKNIRYFMGTESHNTVMIGTSDQMQKGGRFIWYQWSQCIEAEATENDTEICFRGVISAFRQVDKNIRHIRTVTKKKGTPEWVVKDEIQHLPPGMEMKQLWHFPVNEKQHLLIVAKDQEAQPLSASEETSGYSSFYGKKEEQVQQSFCTAGKQITTIINITA